MMLAGSAFESEGVAVGLLTVILALPAAVRRLVGIEAYKYPGEMREDGSGVPFHSTTEFALRPVP